MKGAERLSRGAAALVLLALLAHAPALQGGFLWDDDDYVTENPLLRGPGGLGRIWFEPTALPQYYPLVHTTFWIEAKLWGFRPFGFKVVNLLVHAAAALAAWAVLRRLRVPGAWVAAALFAIHPVQVESVAWITERKNVLSGLFYFLALLALLRYEPLAEPARAEAAGDGARAARKSAAAVDVADRPKGGRGAGGRGAGHAPAAQPGGRGEDYALALVFFIAALLSKTVTASLPAAFLVLAWWKRGRVGRRLVARLAPLFILGLAMGLLTAWLEKHHVGARGEEFGLSFVQRILIAGRAIWFYLGKLAWPSDLSFIYPRWSIDAGSLAAWIFPAAAVALLVVLWALRRRIGRGALAAALLFVGTLFPALGFFDVYPMRYSFVADHFQYLACLPILALVPAAGMRLFEVARVRAPAARSIATGALIGVLAVVSFQRSAVFRDLEGIWRDTIAKNPQSWMARHNLAMILEDQGRIDAAIAEYRNALAIREDLSQTYMNLGLLLAQKGDLAGARASFEAAVRHEPGFSGAHVNLGNVLFKMGDREGAIAQFRRALEIDPYNPHARRNLEILTRPGSTPSEPRQ